MEKLPEYDTIIIGAGPAGLFAAACINRGRTLILEKKEKPGRKLMISGSGQCNFTNSGPVSGFSTHYGNNYGFMKPALETFTNHHAVNWFEKRGIKTITDKNGKIFPASLKASDILNTLLKAASEQNARLMTGLAVQSARVEGGMFLVETADRRFTSVNLILGTGGLSYPSTGSTGDGYSFAKSLGHSIVSPKPALTPVFIKGFEYDDLAGVSLKNAQIMLFRDKREIGSHPGDIVFTHKGLSGPGILDFSRFFEAGDTLKINLCNLQPQEFERQFTEAASENGKTLLSTFLRNAGLTRSLLRIVAKKSGVNPEKPLAEISKQARKALTEQACSHSFIIEKTAGYKTAMATAGGVSLTEVDPLTMESKLVENLYFAGEILDIDGDTGGYNIQAAFSTAWMAAQAIIRKQ